MNEIIATLEALRPIISTRDFRQLTLIIEAMLAMTGRVTMLGISRWAEKGGSYRTIQRFFNAPHDWSKMRWALIKRHFDKRTTLEEPIGVVLLTGDEVVVTKSGKQTHGLGKFFSSTQNQPVNGLCFLNLSLLDVDTRHSYPVITEQLIRDGVKETAPKATKPKGEKGKSGRPKGSKNKDRTVVELTPFQLQLQGCIRQAQELSVRDLKLCYFVYDGALGNNNGLQLVKQTGMHLISKLRHDSELYLPYVGEPNGNKPKKYGDRITLARLEQETVCQETLEKNIRTRVYQIQVWHKKFPELLNVVVIVRTNVTTGSTSKVLLFSDDLNLAYDKLILYYQLRFQIEFNFRDAKQCWGLEDFMNTKEDSVSNAANLSLFMVTFSQLLMPQIKSLDSESVLDLKTVFRARKYTRRIINSLGLKSEEFLVDDQIFQAAEIGRIHKKAA